MLQYLDHAKDIAHMPFLIPILLANAASGGLWDREYEAYGHFNTIRIAMKCDQYDRSAIKVDPRDLADMPRKLTASADNVATVVSFAANLERILKFLEKHFDDYHDKTVNPGVYSEVLDHLHWLQQLIEDVTVKNETVRSAGQAVVQMVSSMSLNLHTIVLTDLTRFTLSSNNVTTKLTTSMEVTCASSPLLLSCSSLGHFCPPGSVPVVRIPHLSFNTALTRCLVWNFDPKVDGPVASKWAIFHFGVSIAMTLAIFIAWRNDSLSRKKKRTKGSKNASKRKNTSRWTGRVVRKLKRTPSQVEDGDMDSVVDGDEDAERDSRTSPWDSLRQKIVPIAQRRKHATSQGGEIAKMVRKTAVKKENKTPAEANVVANS